MAAYTQFGYGYPSASQVCTNPLLTYYTHLLCAYIELCLGLSLVFAMETLNANDIDMVHHPCDDLAYAIAMNTSLYRPFTTHPLDSLTII